MLLLSKLSPRIIAFVGLTVVTASLAAPDKTQAGAYRAGPTPMATVAEVDRAANPLNLADQQHQSEIARVDTGDSPGATGFRALTGGSQRMLITGHNGSGNPADIAGAMSFRKRPLQNQGMGLGAGSGGSGSSGADGNGLNSSLASGKPKGPTTGTPQFFNPPVTAGNVPESSPPKAPVPPFVPSGISNTDIQGQDHDTGNNSSDGPVGGFGQATASFPEPGGLTLLSVGIAGLFGWRRRGRVLRS
jgi:hypothetical protein